MEVSKCSFDKFAGVLQSGDPPLYTLTLHHEATHQQQLFYLTDNGLSIIPDKVVYSTPNASGAETSIMPQLQASAILDPVNDGLEYSMNL